MERCRRCDGTGRIWKYSDYGCPHCNPKHLIDCPECDGAGVVRATAPDAHLEAQYEDMVNGGGDE